MYYKIAKNNVKRSFKDYTIYFLTLTFAVCIFYSFNSVESQKAMLDMSKGQAEYIDIMNQLMSGISIFVSFILAGLIVYATNFLIKRRKKEFGIYMTLGMSKSRISKILFFETMIIGIISLVVGLFLGLVFSQGLSLLTAKLFEVGMDSFKFIISTSAIIKTILYFGIIYFIVILFNSIVISKYKLINLLSASKKNESIKIRNPIISIVILFISIILLIVAYRFAIITNLDFYDKRFTLAIIFGVIGTLGFFFGFSSVVLALIKRSSNIYLKNINAFTVNQITSKFNTNFISMTVICLMLFITIGILTTGLSIKNSLEESLKLYTPYDASINWIGVRNSEEYGEVSVKEALESFKFDIKNDMDIVEINIYKINTSTKEILKNYLDINTQFISLNTGFEYTNVIKLSEFNNLRKLQGKETLSLDNNEVYISSNYDSVKGVIEKFINNNDNIKILDKIYKIKEKEIITDALETSPLGTNVFTIIVPDSFNIDYYESKETKINLNFIGKDIEKNKEYLNRILEENSYGGEEFINSKYFISGYTRELVYNESRGLSTIILFIAIYLGIIFLLSSAAVLALQQLSQSSDSKERYESLKKIGVPIKMINKSIMIEVLIFFLSPLILAIVHSIIGIKVVQGYLIAFGSYDIVASSLITTLIMVIVYGGYLYSTYIGYKNIINNN